MHYKLFLKMWFYLWLLQNWMYIAILNAFSYKMCECCFPFSVLSWLIPRSTENNISIRRIWRQKCYKCKYTHAFERNVFFFRQVIIITIKNLNMSTHFISLDTHTCTLFYNWCGFHMYWMTPHPFLHQLNWYHTCKYSSFKSNDLAAFSGVSVWTRNY